MTNLGPYNIAIWLPIIIVSILIFGIFTYFLYKREEVNDQLNRQKQGYRIYVNHNIIFDKPIDILNKIFDTNYNNMIILFGTNIAESDLGNYHLYKIQKNNIDIAIISDIVINITNNDIIYGIYNINIESINIDKIYRPMIPSNANNNTITVQYANTINVYKFNIFIGKILQHTEYSNIHGFNNLISYITAPLTLPE